MKTQFKKRMWVALIAWGVLGYADAGCPPIKEPVTLDISYRGNMVLRITRSSDRIGKNCNVGAPLAYQQNSTVGFIPEFVELLSDGDGFYNVYYLDGGKVSSYCGGNPDNPDFDPQYPPYIPNKRFYSLPASLVAGYQVGKEPGAGIHWKRPANGLFFLAGEYRQLGCGELFPEYGPFAGKTGTNYVGLKLRMADGDHFGWIAFPKYEEFFDVYPDLRIVIHPEPNTDVQAGMEPVPAAKVRYLAQSVEISWHPAWGDSWKLEASPSLATNATWSAVTSVVSNRAEMATIGSQRFFRLRKSEP